MRWCLPGVRVSDDGHGGFDAANHLRGLYEVVLGGDSNIGHAKPRSGSCGTTRDTIMSTDDPGEATANLTNLWYRHSKPASIAQRALIPSQIPGAIYGSRELVVKLML